MFSSPIGEQSRLLLLAGLSLYLAMQLSACVRTSGGSALPAGDSSHPRSDQPVALADSSGDAPRDSGRNTALSFGPSGSWGGATSEHLQLQKAQLQLATSETFAIKKSKLPTARVWMMSATMGQAIYAFGGSQNLGDTDRSDQILRYDPVLDTVQPVGTLANELSAGVATTIGNTIYIAKGSCPGNISEDAIMRFDPLAPTQAPILAVTGTVVGAIRASAALAPNGLLYLFAGHGTGPMRHEVQTFEAATGQVSTNTTMDLNTVGVRERALAVTAEDGLIYVFGGAKGKNTNPILTAGFTTEILAMDPVKESVAVVAQLPLALANVAGGRLGAEIVLVGGDRMTTSPQTTPHDVAYSFDPQSKQTQVLATLPFELSGASASVGPNGKLYLFGGRRANGALSDAILEFRPYQTSGELVGAVIDSGAADTSWRELSFEATLPPQTSLGVFVRAANQPFAPSAESPPWIEVAAQSPVRGGLPGGRYLQWRFELKTQRSAVSPALGGVGVVYR